MEIDTNFVLMSLGTVLYAAWIFKKLAALATISFLELAILHAGFYLPMQLFARILNTNSWTLFALHLAIGLLLVPVFFPRLRYGVLNRQGFLRLVSLGKRHGTVVSNEKHLNEIDILVVDPAEFEDDESDASESLFKKALASRLSVESVPEFLARNYGFIEIKHHVTASQVKLKKARFFDTMKTLVEGIMSLVFIVIMAPVFVIIWCLVHFFHGAPVLFRQERLGRGGKSFHILKFRTMSDDGKTMCMGEFLRRSHLDELPQLFNVLAGDMALIGPRPEWTFLTTPERAPTDYWIRRTIKPGISGWAQVNYRPSRSKFMREKKLGYDIYYINNRSIFLDALIWVRTIANVMRIFVFWSGRK